MILGRQHYGGRRKLVALIALTLGGCGGTQMIMKGQVCGQAIELSINDIKDRSTFIGDVQCPGGGSIHIESTDSSASVPIAAMTERDKIWAGVVSNAIAKIP